MITSPVNVTPENTYFVTFQGSSWPDVLRAAVHYISKRDRVGIEDLEGFPLRQFAPGEPGVALRILVKASTAMPDFLSTSDPTFDETLNGAAKSATP